MILHKLIIENFMGINSGEVDFSKSGLTLIKGINNDSPTSTSNGAGKSTIYDALYWVIYGKNKRVGLSADDVVNRFAKKNCMVVVTLSVGSAMYRITRTRKHAKLGNSLAFDKIDSNGEVVDPLTKGVAKVTQALIESIINLDCITFDKIVHFGQGDIKPFADLKDAELKRVFEQALGLTYLSDQHLKVKEYLAKLKSDQAVRETKLEILEKEHAYTVEKIDYLNKAIDELYKQKKAEMSNIQNEIKATKADLNDTARRKAATIDEISKKQVDIESGLKRLEELLASKKMLHDAYLERRDNFNRQRVILENNKREVEKFMLQEQNANAKIGRPCGECGRSFTLAEVEPFLRKVQQALVNERSKVKTNSDNAKSAEAAVKQLEDLFAPLEQEIAKFDDVKAETARLEQFKRDLVQFDANINRLSQRLGQLTAQLSALGQDNSNHAEQIDEATEKKGKIEAEVEAIQVELDKIADDNKTCILLAEVLGNSGMKSYIFDNVTPELNKAIDRYIKVLDDIDVEISTVTKLKTGDYREKFEIKVNNLHGAGKYAGNSGGEKQKINMGIALGFNEVMRNMASEPVNVLFLDEPFESLDDSSSEKVVELCQMITGGNFVGIITHQLGVQDLISESIVVEKAGKITKIK